jgi:EpsI family protein
MDQPKRLTLAAMGMLFTAGAAAVLKPVPTQPKLSDGFDLQVAIPKTFGVWSHQPVTQAAIVDPQTKELLDQIYSQMLSRVYQDQAGYRIMLSIAYGSDQRGALQAHKPEICYPAQGFSLIAQADASINTPSGVLPVRQLQMVQGARREPVTYWFTVGEQAVRTAFDRRVATLKSVMTGRIPDGLLLRVSSIDAETLNAFQKQSSFVLDLLSALPASVRTRFSGLK